MTHYTVGQICLNGHWTTRDFSVRGVISSPYCAKCGSKTITECPECSSPIDGYLVEDAIYAVSPVSGQTYMQRGAKYHSMPVPPFCKKCGSPFPWTNAATDSLRAIIDEEVKADKTLANSVKESVPDLMVDTPRTQLATSRMKRFLGACGDFTRTFAIELLSTIATESVKRGLGLDEVSKNP